MATSLRALVSYASNLVSQFPLLNSNQRNVSPYEPLSAAPFCPFDGPMSCHNSTPIIASDSCCFVHPGGRMRLAQIWDRGVHAADAEEDWTLHGLWYETIIWRRAYSDSGHTANFGVVCRNNTR
jgi:ribonuclease T2